MGSSGFHAVLTFEEWATKDSHFSQAHPQIEQKELIMSAHRTLPVTSSERRMYSIFVAFASFMLLAPSRVIWDMYFVVLNKREL